MRLRMPYSSASVVACSGCWDWRQPIPHEAFLERCEVPEGTRPISSFFGIAGRSRNLPCIQIVSLFHFTCLFCLTRKFPYLLCKEGSRNDVLLKPAITSETCPTGGGPRFSAYSLPVPASAPRDNVYRDGTQLCVACDQKRGVKCKTCVACVSRLFARRLSHTIEHRLSCHET